MSTEDKKTDNELIAEFMGERVHKGVGKPAIFTGQNTLSGWEFMRYDTSWDWLMPVVEKIERCGCIVEIWMSLGKGCRIQRHIDSWQTVQESNSTIEAVYRTVIEYIKFRNTQPK